MIPVTKPFSPPIEEYQRLLEGIWERQWFTNNGPLVNQLELSLKSYLGISHLLYVSNGTIALQIAIKALGLKKKIITTPFSYVATTSSIVWEGCTPVFADIDPNTLNINPKGIEALIDDDTEAILATHCFGNPCDIDAIDKIAKKYNLKVIYDAAHCFGTKYNGRSVLEFGDISTISFHATKLFHTVEGGAVVSKEPEIIKKLSFLRNFGHQGQEAFKGIGINAKNSEFHAAMGLINLKYGDDILARRLELTEYYDRILNHDGIRKIELNNKAQYNFAYYPVWFKSEELLATVKSELEKNLIFPRRYFYPSLTQLDYVEGNCPIAMDISSRILCLPLYHDLTSHEQDFIVRVILRTLKYK